MKLGKVVAGGLVGAAMLAFGGVAGTAEAAALNLPVTLNACPASFTADSTAKVHDGGGAPLRTAVSACQYLTPFQHNANASIANINAAGFFGFSDWQSNSQTEMDAPAYTGLTGTWAIAGADFLNYDYIIVFKDGNSTSLIAFAFNEDYASGEWSTPFTNPPFSVGDPRGVSHVTIAKRYNPTDVPEPASLALLGMGLLGLGAMARRRRA